MRKPEDLVPMEVLEGLGIKWGNLAQWYAVAGKMHSRNGHTFLDKLEKVLDPEKVRYEFMRGMPPKTVLRYVDYQDEFEKALFSDPKQDKIDELRATVALVRQQINELENL